MKTDWLGTESILEQDRLFLSKSGIGIYYDKDELGSHSEGGMSYIIPFRKFNIMVEMSGEFADILKAVFWNVIVDKCLYLENRG